jgi:hypothetical protein
MTEQVKIQVIFEEQVSGATYRDAIYYSSMAEYQSKVADGSHEAEKSKRLTNYSNLINNPPAPVVLTKEQLQADKANLLEQIAQLDAQIAVAPAADEVIP